MEKFRLKRQHIDFALALTVFALVVFGVVMIASSSVVISFEKFGGKDNYHFVYRQVVSAAIGFLAMIVLANVDYRLYRRLAPILLLINLVLLVAVFLPLVGGPVKGAHRWLNLGIFSFQPSEVLKLTLVLYLAWWLEKKDAEIKTFAKGFFPFALLLLLISFLIISQPDLGSLSVILFTGVVLFFVGGASLSQLGISLGLLITLFVIFIRTSAYRWQRFLTFLNPSKEVLGAGYHINQAFLAVGSGGLFGLGFGKSIQKYQYLPEPHTDSIFAIIVEELGFLRASLVILAFLFLVYRGLQIAQRAPDKFGRLIATGIVSWIAIQTLINLSAMLGVIPLTGVTLPFVSFGGSSLVISLAAIGILLNISKQCETD